MEKGGRHLWFCVSVPATVKFSMEKTQKNAIYLLILFKEIK